MASYCATRRRRTAADSVSLLLSVVLLVAVGSPLALAADAPKKAPAKNATTTKSTTPPPADANPLARLPAAIQLPTLPTAETSPSEPRKPAALGPVDVQPNMIVLVHLLGAEDFVKKGQQLTIESAAMETPARHWRVELRENESATPIPLAELAIAQGQLTFAWTNEAARFPAAGQLSNCALKLAAGKGTHTLALRRSEKISGLKLAFDGDLVSRVDLKDPPPPSQIQVELRLTGSDVPRYRFVGSSTLRPGESTWIEFIKTKSDQVLKFKIDCQWKRGVEISVDPYFQTAADPKPIRLTDATRKKAETQARLLQQQLDLQAQLANASGKNKNNKKAKGEAAAAPNNAAQTARLVISQIEQLETLEKAIDGKVRLEFRVIRTVEGTPIVLAASAAPPVGKKK